jgi:hypothetical protein
MKLLTLLCLLPFCASAQLVPVVLEWNYPTNELSTNLSFTIYRGTNATQPMNTWTAITNVVGTNLSVEMAMTPGEYFFAAKTSNWWGQSSVFSNVASTPPAPRSDSILSIRRK